jgi:toxin YoeB
MPQALEDLTFWTESGNKQVQQKITLLIEAIIENQFEGIGTSEALKHKLTGKWSRRINREHRLVYEVENYILPIYQLRFHY